MRTFLLVVAMIALAGCSTLGTKKDPIRRVEQDVSKALAKAVPDAQQASRLATAAHDVPAMMCYPQLIKWLKGLKIYQGEATDKASVGAFVTYQRVRNLRRGFTSGVPENVRVACSAMVNESKGVVFKLLAKIGLPIPAPLPLPLP